MPFDAAASPLPVAAALDSSIPLVIGVVLLLAGLAVLLRYRRTARGVDRSRSSWLETQAELVDFELQVEEGTPSWRPVYAFAAPGLRRVHAPSPHDPPVSSKAGLGHARTVFYNPEDARDFTAVTSGDRWITLMAGLALASIGAATIVAWLVAPDSGPQPF